MEKRCFVSVDAPEEVKEYLGRLARRDIYWIHWTNPKNYHITLNFLGDLNSQRIGEAREVLREVSHMFSAFPLRLDKLEAHFDMLWLMPGQNEVLMRLQDELKDRLKNARLAKRERRSFTPHILLAKSKTGRNMKQVIDNYEPREFLVDKINLYESELTPGLATHRLIESFPLKKRGEERIE